MNDLDISKLKVLDDLDNIPNDEAPMYLKEVIGWCEELLKAYTDMDDDYSPGGGASRYMGDEDLGPM